MSDRPSDIFVSIWMSTPIMSLEIVSTLLTLSTAIMLYIADDLKPDKIVIISQSFDNPPPPRNNRSINQPRTPHR